MSPTYEQFREAVLKAASPEHKAEILELKFGCKVLANYPECYEGLGENQIYNQVETVVECFIFRNTIMPDHDDYEQIDISDIVIDKEKNIATIKDADEFSPYFEIIGRDLTLEDVLRVIKNKDPYTMYDFRIGIYDCGVDFEFWEYEPVIRLFEDGNHKFWDLTKHVNQQSDETLLSIIKLLE